MKNAIIIALVTLAAAFGWFYSDWRLNRAENKRTKERYER